MSVKIHIGFLRPVTVERHAILICIGLYHEMITLLDIMVV